MAAALMVYNYARFENPFEFGQTYQITLADQHQYVGAGSGLNPTALGAAVLENFFGVGPQSTTFPYVGFNGAFLNFPLFFLVFCALAPQARRHLHLCALAPFACTLSALPILVTAVDAAWSPFLQERYRLDIYYLLSILVFVAVAASVQSMEDKRSRRFLALLDALCVLTLVSCFLLFLVPYDFNVTDCFPELSLLMRRIVLFH